MLEHGAPVHGVEAAEIAEVPLGEVPTAILRQLADIDAPLAGDD